MQSFEILKPVGRSNEHCKFCEKIYKCFLNYNPIAFDIYAFPRLAIPHALVSISTVCNSNDCTQGCNEGGKEGTIPQASNHYGGAEKSQQCHNYFLQYSKLLSKELRFNQRGAKLAFCLGCYVTSLHPLLYDLFFYFSSCKIQHKFAIPFFSWWMTFSALNTLRAGVRYIHT